MMKKDKKRLSAKKIERGTQKAKAAHVIISSSQTTRQFLFNFEH